MLDGGFIQNSKLLIQNFAARAECAFPKNIHEVRISFVAAIPTGTTARRTRQPAPDLR
jgi:hypothetical protein